MASRRAHCHPAIRSTDRHAVHYLAQQAQRTAPPPTQPPPAGGRSTHRAPAFRPRHPTSPRRGEEPHSRPQRGRAGVGVTGVFATSERSLPLRKPLPSCHSMASRRAHCHPAIRSADRHAVRLQVPASGRGRCRADAGTGRLELRRQLRRRRSVSRCCRFARLLAQACKQPLA